MRHLLLLSMMVLGSTQANAETCVLRMPLKATRPANLQRWESLPAGTELSVVARKGDWTRVLRGETMHVVATAHLANGCVPKAETAPTTEAAKTEAAAPPTTEAAKTEAAAPPTTEAAKAEPAKAAAVAPTTTEAAKAEPAKAAAPAAEQGEAKEAAKTEEPAKAKLALAPTPSSSGQVVVIGVLLLGAVFTVVVLRRRNVVEQQHLDIVASRTLGRGKQLLIVDAGDARLLLGVTEQGITVLSSSVGPGRPSVSESEAPSFPTSSTKPTLSLWTQQQEDEATASPAASLFKGLGSKVTGLWGRPPAGPPSDWDNFDRILASTMPEPGPVASVPGAMDAAPSNSRRPAERSSSVTGSADLAELTRELQRHGARRSA
jgi:flagellar biogenesis protein FliO